MHAVDLHKLLASREAEVAWLRGELSRVVDELARANANITALSEAVATSNDRIAELLAAVQRKKATPPAAKPPEAPPVVDETQRRTFADRPEPPPEPGVLHDRPRERQIPTGRKRLSEDLPADTTTTVPVRCPCGCTDFDLIDEVIEEKLTVVAAHQRRRRTIRKTGRCRSCRRRVTGEAPPSPFERSKVTCEWLAWFIIQKFLLMVPLDRLRRYLGVQGVVLAESFLVTQTAAAAELLEAIDGEHWRELLEGPWLGTDATGFKVQLRDVGLHHGHLEVYHRDDLVVFQYEAEKGGETQAAKLAKFSGTVLVDVEARYNHLIQTNLRVIEANCNAHPRRALRDAEAVQPILAAEGGRFVTAMFDADAEAKDAGLRGDALRDWR